MNRLNCFNLLTLHIGMVISIVCSLILIWIETTVLNCYIYCYCKVWVAPRLWFRNHMRIWGMTPLIPVPVGKGRLKRKTVITVIVGLLNCGVLITVYWLLNWYLLLPTELLNTVFLLYWYRCLIVNQNE